MALNRNLGRVDIQGSKVAVPYVVKVLIVRHAFGQVKSSFLRRSLEHAGSRLMTAASPAPLMSKCSNKVQQLPSTPNQTVECLFSYHFRSFKQVIKLRDSPPSGTERLDDLQCPAPCCAFIAWLQSIPIRTMLRSQPVEVVDLIPHVWRVGAW